MGVKGEEDGAPAGGVAVACQALEYFPVSDMYTIECPNGYYGRPGKIVFGKAFDGYHGLKIIKKTYF
jgi:hypothetical protein